MWGTVKEFVPRSSITRRTIVDPQEPEFYSTHLQNQTEGSELQTLNSKHKLILMNIENVGTPRKNKHFFIPPIQLAKDQDEGLLESSYQKYHTP